ncbi:MAG: hypothetical protein A3H28_11010 [Acidobacteria bacterium RIFCSPLOWO2_02_FULL_61_28]|nr:MAG: hypothetical protein A3H28_11010 [Acidobacteria bacterium RIFCSPLOWO2_02_FULL_61_28]
MRSPAFRSDRSEQHFATGRFSLIRNAIQTFAVVLLAALNLPAQFPTQKPAGYVNDIARVLSPAARQQLEALCAELDQKTKAQLAIVTVQSLEGRPLEEFTVDLATKWGIGPKGSDRGVMLFLAIQDRRNRIEVGYGLEPIIPDGRAGAILRSLTPYLRNGDYDGAMRLGASTIAQIIAQDAGVTLTGAAIPQPAGRPPSDVSSPGGNSWLMGVIWLVILPLILASASPISLTVSLIVLAIAIPTILRSGSFGGFVWLVVSLFAIAILGILFTPRSKRWGRWSGDSGGGGFGGWGGGGGGGGGGFGGFGGGSFGGGGASGSW